ncbi:Sodium/calcium exchanger protein-domain-containing protein [Parachaetomium inaequale]|uniref:Sodium/calcium exchanger protein-domain-containing protein n=1 Tax=Parachaetomium inaequale TaxID=2588326 RepID=A0AAN6SP46_9PEZI|nr:Sodium/calcium exchanger protein-domain-containing protein [Parachaetomium inaequale]
MSGHGGQPHGDGSDGESAPLLPSLRHPHPSGIAHEGESGRSGFHPQHFVSVLWRSSSQVSMLVNILWPFVPAAIILHFVADAPLWTFAASYIGMIPSANLLGFSGQEFARKMPKVAGILIETTFGSIVEIILFVVLIANHNASAGHGSSDEGNLIPVIQAAILGSILTNLLLCLGLCFFFGGLRHASQKFHAIVSEVGSGLLLVAAFALLIPSAFYSALKSEAAPDHAEKPLLGAQVLHDTFTKGKLQADVLQISRAASIVLMVAFALYIWFCASSQHSIFDEVIEQDEHRDADREEDLQKPKFTMTETMVALAVSLVCVTLLLVFLVGEIEHVVRSGVPDQFLGLILLPLVEKAAEHLTAIDEARDGMINVALYHCLGPSIQTALFNAPLVVIVAWIMGKPLDLNFEIFMIGLLVLSILVVGNFLRDGESNWLEGALLVVVYVIIAIACWYYPDPDVATSNGLDGSAMVNVAMSKDMLEQLQQLLKTGLGQ